MKPQARRNRDHPTGLSEDVEPTVWANFLARWEDTHDRQPYPHPSPYEVLAGRPHLPHLSLTCDNVETSLPYLDLVNEILEYFVANRGLTADAARNTGGASSAELLAEPANVIEKAYDELGAARYPSLDAKAAALLHSLARNHALIDGNKRLALGAVIAFYGLNGRRLTLTNDQAYDLVMKVAAPRQ